MTVVGRPETTKRANFALAHLSQGGRRLFSARSARQSTLAPRLIEITLVIILGILLALICLRIFTPLPLPTGDPIVATNPNAAAPRDIVVRNPFPVTEVATIIEDTAPDVVDTTLDLTLTGVWVVAGGGSATIETPDGEQSRFAVGDEIVDGVTLETVYPDQVIINRRGAREALRFESKIVAPSAPAQRAPEPNNPPARNFANVNGGSPSIADFIRFAPATDVNGQFAVDIYAARDRQTFNNYGFRDGDRVVSINGTPPPSNTVALIAMMNSLQRITEATIVVARDDREVPITLSLDGERTQ